MGLSSIGRGFAEYTLRIEEGTLPSSYATNHDGNPVRIISTAFRVPSKREFSVKIRTGLNEDDLKFATEQAEDIHEWWAELEARGYVKRKRSKLGPYFVFRAFPARLVTFDDLDLQLVALLESETSRSVGAGQLGRPGTPPDGMSWQIRR